MRVFLRQFRSELRKMFARKRTYIGFGAFFCIELLVLGLLQLPKVQRAYRYLIEGNGYAFETYYSGLTLAFLILTSTIFFLGSLYLALVSGDVVSKEVEDGTLRMMLCRPISRGRILLLKYLSCVVYTFALIAFIGLSALGAGLLQQGMGGMFVFSPLEKIFALYDFEPGLARYLAALPLMALSLTTISSLGFMLSCCNMKPAAATIVTLSALFVDGVFRTIPYFDSVKGWFITTHMATWINLFQPHIPAFQICEDYAILLGVNGTLVLIGAVVFMQRDLKS